MDLSLIALLVETQLYRQLKMEKKVTYSKFFIALICLFASNSFAFDIITSSEESALREIQQNYDVDSQLITANDKLSRYNKSQYDHEALALSIYTAKGKYKQLIKTLPEKVISGEGVAEYFKEIENVLLLIDRSEAEHIAGGIALKEEYQMIEMDYVKLNDLRSEKNKKLSLLKKQVVDRLVSDFSKPNSTQKFNRQGTAVCSTFQSISDCLSENEKIIISKTKKTEPFLNDRSVLLSYKVHDASMSMNGGLNYDVSMTFKSSYNNRVEALLNEKFGLKSALITLESNVVIDWFIDGNKVGKGKKIEQEVTLGRHGIMASYKSEGQSTVEIIEGNGQFTYVFENTVAPLLPKKNIALKKESKPAVNKSKSVVKKEKPAEVAKEQVAKKKVKLMQQEAKPAEKVSATTDEQDYLYFMGIEPDSPQQKSSFAK